MKKIYLLAGFGALFSVSVVANSTSNGKPLLVQKVNLLNSERLLVLKGESRSVASDNDSLSLSPSKIAVDPTGGEITVAVKASKANWKLEPLEDELSWVVASVTNGDINVKIKFNSSGVDREATIHVKQGKKTENLVITQAAYISPIESKRWLSVAVSQPRSWYGSKESVEIAENVLLYQRKVGGWPKNIPMHHLLTDGQKAAIESQKKTMDAIFDNGATTSEMKFLGKMYKVVKDERYKTAVSNALDFIIKAQYGSSYKGEGGWPQMYPLVGKGYKDRITFNDNAMTSLLRVLRDIYQNKGDFTDIISKDVAEKAKLAYDKGIQCILNCQVKEDGVKTFWCAQHDENTLDPAFGRPHELPSYSGCEGVDILRFLMEIENPSQEVKDAVVAAATWLEKAKIPNKKVIDISEGGVLVDKKVVDSPGDDLWGRFIQIGGSVGKRVYGKLTYDLSKVVRSGVSMKENVETSYDPKKVLQPIFGIYDNNRPEYLYRFLYIYEDAPLVNNRPVSLDAGARRTYLYYGSWAQNLLRTAYPNWLKKNGL